MLNIFLLVLQSEDDSNYIMYDYVGIQAVYVECTHAMTSHVTNTISLDFNGGCETSHSYTVCLGEQVL